MIDLSKKQFVPAMILLNIVFMPPVLILLICFLLYQELRFLLIGGMFLLFYAVGLMLVCKAARSKEYYLMIENNGLKIHCGNKYCDKDTGFWTISYDDILQLDYYKTFSLKGWFILWNGLFPNSVFVTFYDVFGQELSVFIGYMDIKQIKGIAAKGNVKLVLH